MKKISFIAVTLFFLIALVAGWGISQVTLQKDYILGSSQASLLLPSAEISQSLEIETSEEALLTTGRKSSEIVGILINSDPANSEKVLSTIENRGQYKTILVLASGASSKENEIIQKSFPKATLQMISIDSIEQIPSIAEQLWKGSQNHQESSLIIVEGDPNFSNDPLIREFQEDFYNDVINNYDSKKFNDLLKKAGLPMIAFKKYLEFQGIYSVKFEKMNKPGEVTAGLFKTNNDSTPLPENRSAYIVFFGDIMLGRNVRNLMNRNGLHYPFAKIDLGYLKMNDFLVANLEGPIAKNAIKTSKTIAFRFLPDVAPLLKNYFFDVLSTANNHALDMGLQGYNATYELLKEQNLIPFGNPREITEESAAKVYAGGKKIVFLGMEEVVFRIDQEKAIQKIQELTNQGYTVISFVHWGQEYQHEPNKRQQELAHAFIDAGAIAVIGHHPHVVQSYENYNNHPIFYSLGNAVFDQYFSKDTQEGLSIAAKIDDNNITIYLLPINIVHSQMQLMNEEERKVFLKTFADYGEHSAEEKEAIMSGKIVLGNSAF